MGNAINLGGGSLPSFINKIEGGTFVPESNSAGMIIFQHTLGVIPKGIVFYTNEGNYIGDGAVSICSSVVFRHDPYSASEALTTKTVAVFNISEKPSVYQGNSTGLGISEWWYTDHFCIFTTSDYPLLANRIYHWLVWA